MSINNEAIIYTLNDPSTPDLVMSIQPLPLSSPPYFVNHYIGGTKDVNSKEYHAANCYTTITCVLNYYNNTVPDFIKSWLCKTLKVMPVAFPGLNAMYTRDSIRLGYYKRQEIGGCVFTADSADIVSHELGHAILDSAMSRAFNSASFEVWSFHEAFADWTAIIGALSHDEIIRYVLDKTSGDLRQPNVVSNLAEQFGRAIYTLTKNTARSPDCLRSALNDFQYVDPSTLPKKSSYDQLYLDSHSFGRVFLGTFYDMLVTIYEDSMSKWKTPVDALKEATASLTKRIWVAVRNAPVNVHFYDSIAKTILWAEKTKFDNIYYEKFQDIFQQRNLIRPTLSALSIPSRRHGSKITLVPRTITTKIGNHFLRAQSSNPSNPLYDAEVEIPYEQAYFYDNNSNFLDASVVSEESSLEAAQLMLECLPVDDSPFSVRNGKLIRTHFT